MTHRENCEEKMDQFLKRCFYHAGQYNSEEHFAELDSKLKEKEVMCYYISFSRVFHNSECCKCRKFIKC